MCKSLSTRATCCQHGSACMFTAPTKEVACGCICIFASMWLHGRLRFQRRFVSSAFEWQLVWWCSDSGWRAPGQRALMAPPRAVTLPVLVRTRAAALSTLCMALAVVVATDLTRGSGVCVCKGRGNKVVTGGSGDTAACMVVATPTQGQWCWW